MSQQYAQKITFHVRLIQSKLSTMLNYTAAMESLSHLVFQMMALIHVECQYAVLAVVSSAIQAWIVTLVLNAVLIILCQMCLIDLIMQKVAVTMTRLVIYHQMIAHAIMMFVLVEQNVAKFTFFAAIEVQGSPSCYLYQECDCVENGNDAGQFCEILCDEGEIPCGEEVSYGHPYSSYGCCSSSDECYQTAYKWGPFSYCLWKDRPTTCDPDPCLNGAFCQDNGEYFSGLYSCICEEGFSGAYCEDEILD
mmetsp:Transcript_11489/g.17103  ORF Transcript_11489/g.17103 Transcript_11489/m.17103 type:complete len:250 (-) Transcript_11489:43-792(-)